MNAFHWMELACVLFAIALVLKIMNMLHEKN